MKKRPYVKIKLKRDGETVRLQRNGTEREIAKLLISALAFHLYETLSMYATNEQLAASVSSDLLAALEKVDARK